jgi:phytoene synthase
MTTQTINLPLRGTSRIRDARSQDLKTTMNPNLTASYEAARTVARHDAGPMFHALSLALPRERRLGAYAVSAFFRHVKEALGRAKTEEERYAARLELEEDLPEIFAGRTIGQRADWIPAFADTVERFAIPRQYFEDMIRGIVLETAEDLRMESWKDLREYCYYTAGSLALIMARLFDLRDERGEESAVCLGVGMQLTRMCRDVGRDLKAGRVLIPRSELREFGISEEDLQAGRISAEFRHMMAYQLDRARSYYLRAEEGIPLLGSFSGRFCAWMARYLYAGIHGRIERGGYDTLRRRVRTNPSDKLALVLRAVAKVLRPRPLDPEFFRHHEVEFSHAP